MINFATVQGFLTVFQAIISIVFPILIVQGVVVVDVGVVAGLPTVLAWLSGADDI